MTKKLVLLEFKEEAGYFLKYQPEILTGGAKVISLLPETSEILLENGIAFETSAPYFSKESHERCLGCVDAVIQEVNASMSVKDSYGIRHAYTNALTFYLRQFLGYVVATIEVIENACKQHAVDEIIVCRYSGNDHSQLTFSSKERILSEIAGLFAPHVRIQSPDLNIPPQARAKQWRQWLRSLVCAVYFPIELWMLKKRSRPSMVYYSYKYRFDGIAKAFKDCDHYNAAPEVKSFMRLTDDALGFVSRNVHLDGIRLSKDQEFSKTWIDSVEIFKRICDRKRLCVWRGRDFSAMVFRKIDKGYGPQLARLNRTVASLRKFLAALKPVAVLSHVARDFSYALGELAERMNIPSILISHGSHVPPNNEFDRMEWFDHGKGLINTDYRYHLLQSPWAVEHVKAMGYQGNYYAVEPLIFPKVDRSGKLNLTLKMFPRSQGKKIFVHAGTPKPRGSNRLYIYETLDEYVAYMSDLVEAARNMPEVFLIIRFRPYTYLSTEQLKTLLPAGDHYVIAAEGPFADYLKIADVMVSFSSTTIEEALINGIPVLQYDPSDRYMHIPGARWQDKAFAHADSVYYIGNRNGLVPGMTWILNNHLNATLSGDLFQRHVFKPGDAMTVEELITRLLKKDLPQPISLKEKKQLEGVEIF